MTKRFVLVLVAALAALALAPSAHADTPYAFAVQPVGCTPGYVHLNHTPGVDWSLDGDPVEVAPPSTAVPFPGGFQGDATATGADTGTYYLTVNAVPSTCYPPVVVPPPAAPDATDTPPDLARIIADLKVERTVLQAENSNLRREVRRQHRVIVRQDRVIDRLRARIDRLRTR